MNIYLLLDEAEKLLGKARWHVCNDSGIKAEEYLVKLRELLNSQPELEARDTIASTKSKRPTSHIFKGDNS